MKKHKFRRVEEGIFRYGVTSMLLGMVILPYPLLASQSAPAEPASLSSHQAWQTELVLAESKPVLLQAKDDAVHIELVQSRADESAEAQRLEEEKQRQEEQQKLAEQQQQLQLAAMPKTVTPSAVTTGQTGCTNEVSEAEKDDWANKAASAYGIDPRLLKAVWQVESGKRFCTTVQSYAGAQGPLQFVSGTWRHYAHDGNGDGVASIYDARDALYGAANLLAANGASQGDNRRALYAYNHSASYVSKVLGIANLNS